VSVRGGRGAVGLLGMVAVGSNRGIEAGTFLMSHHETPAGRDYPECSSFQIPYLNFFSLLWLERCAVMAAQINRDEATDHLGRGSSGKSRLQLRRCGGVRGVCQCDQDGDAAGSGWSGVAECAVPGCRPPRSTDLTREIGCSCSPYHNAKQQGFSPCGRRKDCTLTEPLINYVKSMPD